MTSNSTNLPVLGSDAEIAVRLADEGLIRSMPRRPAAAILSKASMTHCSA
jgi:hypothetical protein